MTRFIFVLVLAASLIFSTSVFAQGPAQQNRIDKAATIISEFKQMPEDSIPPDVIENCIALGIVSVGKAGFILSARAGKGIIVAKTPTGWSAPAFIGTGGGGFGFQIGAEITDFILVINTQAGLDALSKTNCALGGDASIAAGPVGRTAEAAVAPATAIFTYSRSKGLFAGVSLEGTVIAEDKKANQSFYGQPLTNAQILAGAVPPPASAQTLYNALGQPAPAAVE